LSKEESKMIQGLSVLAMVCLHLFDRHDYQDLYVPLLYIKDIPLSFYFGQLSDFCVMGFAFCSGYGHLKSFSTPQYYKRSIIRLFSLYSNFWIILILFSLIGVIAGQSSFIPGNAITFIKTFTTISPAYNGAWWYLPVYAVMVLISPIVLKCSKKINSVIIAIITVMIYCLSYMLRFKWRTGIETIDWFGPFGMTFAEYMIGVICCKEKVFEKLKAFCTRTSKFVLYTVFVILIIGMLLSRTLLIQSLVVAPVTGFIIICIFVIINKPKFIRKIFMFIGEHSTNIWLVHMFFYLVLFKNFVYIARYPILIFTLMILLCIMVSYVIRLIHNPIKKAIMKLN